jgi:hypothetical protein
MISACGRRTEPREAAAAGERSRRAAAPRGGACLERVDRERAQVGLVLLERVERCGRGLAERLEVELVGPPLALHDALLLRKVRAALRDLGHGDERADGLGNTQLFKLLFSHDLMKLYEASRVIVSLFGEPLTAVVMKIAEGVRPPLSG